MSIFKTAYDTRACNGYQMSKVQDAVQRAAADGQLNSVPATNIYLLEGGSSVADAVPAFAHPLYVEMSHRDAFLALDVRGLGRFDQAQQKFVVRNQIEYKLALQRAQLNDVWITRGAHALQNVSPLPMALFSNWISENVAKRYALDPNEQLKLALYAAVFYCSLFEPSSKTDFTDEDKNRMAASISRTLRVSAQQVMELLQADTPITGFTDPKEGCPVIHSVGAFCSVVQEISIRLKEFNVGVLYSILGGTWYGINPREMVAVAVEHPPTWMAILVAAFYERSFKNSGITKLVERRSHRNDGDTYVHAVLNLIRAHSS